MSLTIAQQSTRKGKGHWEWSVWLEGTAAELDEVESIEYTLHPTFSPPVHRVTNRSSSFRLNASGWGEFMVHAKVRFRDGRSESLRHWLELADEPPARGGDTAPAAEPRSIFLSSALADRVTAYKIRAVLEQHESLDVSTSQDLQALEADEPIEHLIRAEMERVDGAVFLVSERESPWLRYELAVARELKIPTTIVKVGRANGVPADTITPNVLLELADPADAEQVARQIAAWAEGLD